jgi:RNA-directed DNA polymerase
MRRVGRLWPQIATRENLLRAFHKAARGKRERSAVQRFRLSLETNIQQLRREIETESYQLGAAERFVIHDPKRREIYAAHFPERVLQHAVMNLCEPVLERRQSGNSHACRTGKGQYTAVQKACEAARRYPWFLKFDIRKYFDSIGHACLLGQLQRVFKDPALLRFWERLLASYHTSPGRGLPIGSLTSQHLANFHLTGLDQFARNAKPCLAYVRYMDDFVLWGEDRSALRDLRAELLAYLRDSRGLVCKHEGCLQRSTHGMDFLGYRIFPHTLRLSRRSLQRFRTKFRTFRSLYEGGAWDQGEWLRHISPLTAFATKASGDRRAFHFIEQNFRAAAIGLEPGQPGRLLEQQRAELPFGQPQQEHAGQPQQQPWFPPRPKLKAAIG